MAGPTRAAGYPDYSSSSTSGFIPEIWSGKLVQKFYAATVLGTIANTDYEGEITAHGDKVQIRTTPDIIIRDYEVGGGINYERPTNPKVELNIDKGKYFAFEINDVDAHQSDLTLMNNWSDDAAQQMKIAVDTDVLGNFFTDVAAVNKGATAGKISGNLDLGVTGTPVQLTTANILGRIIDCGQALDETNTVEEGRWIILPAWAISLLKQSDIKDASLSGDGTSPLRNGRVGMIDRFTVFSSNLLSHALDGADDSFNIVAGHKGGLTFAAQMTNMETLKNPNDFGDMIRGLNVYGYKVIDGERLVHLYVKK